MTIIATLILVAVALILWLLRGLAADVRAIRYEVFPAIRTALQQGAQAGSGAQSGSARTRGHHHFATGFRGRFVVWEWRGGDWQPKAHPEGAEPGAPPAFEGAFEGDLRRLWIMGNGT